MCCFGQGVKGGFSDSYNEHRVNPTCSSDGEKIFVGEKLPEEGAYEVKMGVGYYVDSIHHCLTKLSSIMSSSGWWRRGREQTALKAWE